MRLTDIAEGAASALITRYVKRAILAALVGIFAIVTLYYLSAAGLMALALTYGSLYAYLIMAGIYAVAALSAFAVFYATRNRTFVRQNAVGDAAGSMSPRNMQIAMLVEAVMLGYTLARKSGNKSII
ncbi:hypothetical protein [Pseudolabrys sp. FHR47]|uniref:hypothetical protein n=1 Tax=Pseudolabrys sp. FHR47 TaxID=2562284 RepID=UPI0010BEC1F7|nr:hypothetical protein [Pseudolabrys sp. FHR47]